MIQVLLEEPKLVVDRALRLGILGRTRHVGLERIHYFLVGVVVHHGVLEV